MEEFLSEVNEGQFQIRLPFRWHTKADAFEVFRKYGYETMIRFSTSCGATRRLRMGASHCGFCSQCIDRRLAGYAAGLDSNDPISIYGHDIVSDTIGDPGARGVAIDYIRQAVFFATSSEEEFQDSYASQLAEILNPNSTDMQPELSSTLELLRKHGQQVIMAIKRIQSERDSPTILPRKDSLIDIIRSRPYLDEPRVLFCGRIAKKLERSIPIIFQSERPRHENQLNDAVESILAEADEVLQREFPAVTFGLKKRTPDHRFPDRGVLVEVKYPRNTRPLVQVTDEILADLSAAPERSYFLFVIYDPDRMSKDDESFKKAIEGKGGCCVSIIR